MNTVSITFRIIKPQEFETLKTIMRAVGWPEHYVGVHALTAEKFTQDEEGEVYVALVDNEIAGFISLRHQHINFLTYVATLVVAKEYHRKGLGKALLDFAEDKARTRNHRGIFLDTPVDNTEAREFYKAIGFQEAYTMPYYYSDESHGITYLKLFNRKI